MTEPLAPRNKLLPNYAPGSRDFASPRRRWSGEEQAWVDVEFARTPLLDARRDAASIERAAAKAIELEVDELPEPKPLPETPTQHLRQRSPWWRHFRSED